jgi:DNA-binding MarR family transcriptional regulator
LLILESSPRRELTRIVELSEALGLVPSTMTELLDRAEAAGLLERADAAHDGRVTHVRATADGRKRLAKAFRELADERRNVAGTASALLEDAEAGA